MSTKVTRRSSSTLSASTGPLSPHPPTTPVAVASLSRAKRALGEAEQARVLADRFTCAYEAALKAAAAVVSVRGRPYKTRSRPASVWVLLDSAAPELAEWSAFFAAHSTLHSSVQAGVTRRLTVEATEELLRQARAFVELVRRLVYGGEAHDSGYGAELRAG